MVEECLTGLILLNIYRNIIIIITRLGKNKTNKTEFSRIYFLKIIIPIMILVSNTILFILNVNVFFLF